MNFEFNKTKMKKILPFILIILFGCGSNESGNSANPPKPPADTVGQQVIPQPPVSADSAGARKKQERSSVDTVQRP
jgi:hypothetical protein